MKSIKYLNSDRTLWKDEAGRLHRVDGPAIERINGTNEWYLNGRLHREDGPAVNKYNGTTMWYFNGVLHRVNEPAITIPNEKKEWWFEGNRHRVDGPAVEYKNGSKSWYVKGIYFPSKEAWFNALTKEEQIAYLFNMEGNK